MEESQKITRPKGRAPLTQGQVNILLAKLIDHMAEGGDRKNAYLIIKNFYKETLDRDLAPSTYYEIFSRAKKMWLTNFTLPNLEEYKKDKLIKSELLEEEIKNNSSKDIVDQAKAINEIWRYQDKLVGLDSDTPIDSVVVSINLDKKNVINALEVSDEDEVIDVTPKDKP